MFHVKNCFLQQLVATRDKLKIIEKQLVHAINLYKKRLDWLTCERYHLSTETQFEILKVSWILNFLNVFYLISEGKF